MMEHLTAALLAFQAATSPVDLTHAAGVGCAVGGLAGATAAYATSVPAGLAMGPFGAVAIPTGVVVAPYAASAGCVAGVVLGVGGGIVWNAAVDGV
jgi:hypothetical protein